MEAPLCWLARSQRGSTVSTRRVRVRTWAIPPATVAGVTPHKRYGDACRTVALPVTMHPGMAVGCAPLPPPLQGCIRTPATGGPPPRPHPPPPPLF